MAETYTQAQLKVLTRYIEQRFGHIDAMFTVKDIAGHNVNIYVCPPNDYHDNYVLVTLGLGVKGMSITNPYTNHELTDHCELIMTLAYDWPLYSNEERFYWPIRTLLAAARFTFLRSNIWINVGTTLNFEGPLGPNTALSGILFLEPMVKGEISDNSVDIPALVGTDGDIEITFLHTIPLYPEEIAYQEKNSTAELVNSYLYKYKHVVDPQRERPLLAEAEQASKAKLIDLQSLTNLSNLQELTKLGNGSDKLSVALALPLLLGVDPEVD